MQRAVNTFTDKIFPGVYVFKDKESRPFHRNPYGCSVSSNLPLQMSLYFNVFYFPCWLFVSMLMLILKYGHLHPLYRVVLIAILIVASIVEAVRLYIGYLGNLSEMIPELAGFWLLTLLLQLPLQLFLCFNEAAVILPMERAANLIMILFVILELCFGYFAIKQTSKQLATKFYLETFQLNVPPPPPSL